MEAKMPKTRAQLEKENEELRKQLKRKTLKKRPSTPKTPTKRTTRPSPVEKDVKDLIGGFTDGLLGR